MKKIAVILLVFLSSFGLFAVSSISSAIIKAVNANDVYSFKYYIQDNPEDSLTINYYGSEVNIYKYIIDNGNTDFLQTLMDAGVDYNSTFTYWSIQYTPLEYAIENNKTWAVQQLLSADDIIKNDDDNSLLYTAVASKNIATIKLLIQFGINVNDSFSNSYGDKYTALSYALSNNYTDFFNQLLTIEGIDVDCIGSKYPALYYAISKDNETLVNTLLQMGAHPGRTFTSYSTVYNCLTYAISNKKSFAIINSLIQASDSEALAAYDCTKSPLYYSTYNNDQSVTEALVNAGANVNTLFTDSSTVHNALTYAISRKCSEKVIEALLNSPSLDLNYNGCTTSPYYYALYNKNPEVLKALVSKGVNPNKIFTRSGTNYSPLSYAIYNDYDQTYIDILLSAKKIDLNGRGSAYPPIYYAIIEKNNAVLEKLISNGCNINKTFKYSNKVYTPLGYANYRGYSDATLILILAGASPIPVAENNIFKESVDTQNVDLLKSGLDSCDDVNEIFEIDSSEYSLLSYACYKNVEPSFLQEILQIEDIDIVGEECPVSPMAYAVINGNVNNVKLLIDAGINPNLTFKYSSTEYTPLYYAVSNGNTGMIEMLIAEEGIDLYQEKVAYNAMKYLIQHQNFPMIQKFISAGFDVNHKIMDNYNMLTYAVSYDCSTSFISNLLSLDGIDVNSDESRYSVLELAIDNKNLNVLNLLVEKGADVNSLIYYYSDYSTNAIGYAIYQERRMSFINTLINADGADVNAADRDLPCVISAIANGDLEALQSLINAGANVNIRYDYSSYTKMSALEYAVYKKGRLSIINAIIEAPSFDRTDTSAITAAYKQAIDNNDFEIIASMLEHGLDANGKIMYYSTEYSLPEYAIRQDAVEDVINLFL